MTAFLKRNTLILDLPTLLIGKTPVVSEGIVLSIWYQFGWTRSLLLVPMAIGKQEDGL